MPVTVQCFHCNAILELDDGFRGGVCRCSTCGSLLQVPRGDDGAPATPRVRPATPPPPSSPTSPIQSATSSKLDVGLSRGQFDAPSSSQLRRTDIGMSSGLGTGRIHQTTPIAAPPHKSRRKHQTPASPPAAPAPPTPPPPRSNALFWLGLLLAVLITAVLATLVIYYVYYYEPPMPFPPH